MFIVVFAVCVLVGFVLRRTAMMVVLQPQPSIPYASNGKHTDHGILLERDSDEITVFLNGNTGQACEGMDCLEQITSLRPTDLLAIEYPGYGGKFQTESPCLTKCVGHVRAVIMDLSTKYKNIHLVAQSIGTMVLAVALRDIPEYVFPNISSISLVTPFDSLVRVSHHAVPVLGPIGLFLAYPTTPSPKQCWETIGHHLVRNKISVTLYLAKEDQITPYETGVRLYRTLRELKCDVRRYDLETGHNEIFCEITRNRLM
jgi:pimeloyl-ACP methyl ester carboxylesterase